MSEDKKAPALSYEERVALMNAKSKKGRRGSRGDEGPSLNINSMMDMMVIILCFLLMSVGSDPLNVKQNDDLRLANSTTEVNPEDSLTITISRQYVLVGDRRVLTLNDGRIDQQDLASSESALIPELQSATEDVLAQREALGAQVGREYAKIATIICDNRTPYNVLARVMRSAAAGGVESFRFAVIRRTQGDVGGSSES